MERKTVLLDGASGTRMWELAEETGCEKVPVWRYNIEQPQLVSQTAREYVEAGSDIIYTNTFSANGAEIKRASCYSTEELFRAAVKCAREAAGDSGVKIALDIGPLNSLLKPYGTLSEADCAGMYEEMIGCGMDAGADCIVLETFIDLEMLKIAAGFAAQYNTPLLCSMSFGKKGRTIMGNRPEDIVRALEPFSPAGIGINCSFGPRESIPVLERFEALSNIPLLFKPNAGLPVTVDGKEFPYSAELFAQECEGVINKCGYIGVCCGSNPDYIRALRKLIKS